MNRDLQDTTLEDFKAGRACRVQIGIAPVKDEKTGDTAWEAEAYFPGDQLVLASAVAKTSAGAFASVAAGINDVLSREHPAAR
jgi:hypothetical protein